MSFRVKMALLLLVLFVLVYGCSLAAELLTAPSNFSVAAGAVGVLAMVSAAQWVIQKILQA